MLFRSRKVAVILDSLKASTTANRNAMVSNFNTNKTAVLTAMANLNTAHMAASVQVQRNTIGRVLDLYSPQECANYFAACGYDAD